MPNQLCPRVPLLDAGRRGFAVGPHPLGGSMTLPDVPYETGTLEQARSRAIERQLAIERGMVRSIVRGIVVALPLSIAVLIGMLALAISNEQPGTSGSDWEPVWASTWLASSALSAG